MRTKTKDICHLFEGINQTLSNSSSKQKGDESKRQSEPDNDDRAESWLKKSALLYRPQEFSKSQLLEEKLSRTFAGQRGVNSIEEQLQSLAAIEEHSSTALREYVEHYGHLLNLRRLSALKDECE